MAAGDALIRVARVQQRALRAGDLEVLALLDVVVVRAVGEVYWSGLFFFFVAGEVDDFVGHRGSVVGARTARGGRLGLPLRRPTERLEALGGGAALEGST